MISPVIDLPWWGYVLVALGITHITIVSVTVFLHRHQAHSALDMHPVLSHLFRFWLWLTTGIVTKEWVAVHRKHHAKVESDEDPHSPQVHGINAVLWGGLILYRRGARTPGILDAYGKGTPDDWLERHLYAKRSNYGITALLLINLALFGIGPGLAIWVAQMLWIPFWAAGVINGIGHFFGYRNYELPDESRNIVPWGVIIGGEELHNNHHAFAGSAQFSTRPWEVDLGWQYIRLLALIGMIKVRRKLPVLSYNCERDGIDSEAAKAFVTNRFDVVANYAREVLKNVYYEELRSATGEYRKKVRRVRRLMMSEKSRLSVRGYDRLQSLLQSNKRLSKAYAMKESLHSIALRSSVSYESLRQSLEDWCRSAEESGIESLMQFSMRLRSCTTT